MNETTTLQAGSPADSSADSSADRGLRSVSGIRWLLLAGSLVTGVSVYRLVQARWTAIPVPAQFLILVAAALAIFTLGNVTRRRLHLPAAGSALLSLFAGLVPVMAWGAVYLRLLDTFWGWLAFGAGGAVLIGAAVSLMRSTFRYPGKLYPAALGILFVAQPVVRWLGERLSPGLAAQAGAVYAIAAVALGAVLFLGSRHVNRFFFHRDRRDGLDRTVHLVPFLVLGLLYFGSLSLLDLRSPFLALPLAVLGLVFVSTGEEYYRALSESLGKAPESWPARSVALLAVGFSCLVAALPLALLDSSLRCLPLVAACAAVVFLRWGMRYGRPMAHVAGVAAAFVAYHSSPALFPELIHPLKSAMGALLGFDPDSTAPAVGWGDVGFLSLLFLFGWTLRRREAPETVRRAHGTLTFLQVLAIAGLALLDVHAAVPLLAVTLAVTVLGSWATRRLEPALAGQFTFAALAFAVARNLGLEALPAMIATLTLTGLELGGLAVATRRAPGRLARACGMTADDFRAAAIVFLRPQIWIWTALATAACLLFAGFDTLVLSLVLVALFFLSRTEIEGWAPRIAVPARLMLLPLLQIAVIGATGGNPGRDLPVALLDVRLLPWIALLGLAWRGLIELLGRRHSLGRWTLVIEILTGLGIVAVWLQGVTSFSFAANAALIAAALGWATVAVIDGLREGAPGFGTSAQLWSGLAVLHGFTAGWLHLGSGVAPYALLAVGAAEYALGAWLEREDLGPAFVPSCRFLGLALPFLAGGIGLARGGVWLPALAAFLASLFFLVVALREERRIFPALASAAFLGLALLKVIAAAGLGAEICFLAPGLALILLSVLLRRELGPAWSRHVAAAGASCVYATPIVALSDAVSWGWLAALLVTAVAFGAGSFALRSRSLLTVSTAALLTDLGFFVLRIGTAAPTLLWVLGLGFGLALMGIAGWLESRREGVLQQIRLFGRELRAWN